MFLGHNRIPKCGSASVDRQVGALFRIDKLLAVVKEMLVARSFGESADFLNKKRKLWDWKFEQNPYGR
jgi:hypothetical protein